MPACCSRTGWVCRPARPSSCPPASFTSCRCSFAASAAWCARPFPAGTWKRESRLVLAERGPLFDAAEGRQQGGLFLHVIPEARRKGGSVGVIVRGLEQGAGELGVGLGAGRLPTGVAESLF